MDEKIAKILEFLCPAFHRDGCSGGVVWHHCSCLAQTPSGSAQLESCTCVWRSTDTCIAGTWPQLHFINETQETMQKNANVYLAEAKAAISKAKK